MLIPNRDRGPILCGWSQHLSTIASSAHTDKFVCSSPSQRRTPGSVFCTAKAFFVYPLQADAIVIASNIYLVIHSGLNLAVKIGSFSYAAEDPFLVQSRTSELHRTHFQNVL